MSFDVLDVREECRNTPGFDAGTAFGRTKIACDVLVRRGEAIPSWERLREIIERGSSNDISKGVRAYRAEHAAMLSKLRGGAQGVPEPLADTFRQLWEQALSTARQEFVAASDQMRLQLDVAVAQAKDAADESARLEGRVRELLAQLEAAGATQEALKVQVQAERAAREQAERMFERNSAEIAAQRDELRNALSAAQVEWRKSLDRLDSEHRRALLQIEEARTKAQKDVDAARQATQRARDDAEMEAARSSTSMQELRQHLSKAEARYAASQQEAQELRARLARAEAQADAFASAATRDGSPSDLRRSASHRIRPGRPRGQGVVSPTGRRKPPR